MYCYRGNFEGHYEDMGFSIIAQPYTLYNIQERIHKHYNVNRSHTSILYHTQNNYYTRISN